MLKQIEVGCGNGIHEGGYTMTDAGVNTSGNIYILFMQRNFKEKDNLRFWDTQDALPMPTLHSLGVYLASSLVKKYAS